MECLLLMLAALILVAISAGPASLHSALWTDELFSLATAELPPDRMLSALHRVEQGWYDQPPLYFLLLRAVLAMGNDPLTLRLPSMIFVAAMAGLWGILLRRRGAPLAVAIAFEAWLAWHPLIRFHAGSVRMYALLLLETAAIFWMVMDLLRAGMRPPAIAAIGLVGLLTASIYTSYFAGPLAVGIALLGATAAIRPGWWRGKPERQTHRRLAGWFILAACAVCGLLLLPWTPAILRVMALERPHVHLTSQDRWREFSGIMLQLAGGGPAAAVLGLGWLGVLLDRRRRQPWCWALIGWMAIPTLILFGLNPASYEFHPRYLIFLAPPLAAAGASGWLAILRRFRWNRRLRTAVVTGLLLCGAVAGEFRARATFLAPMPDWWGAAQILEANARPEEIILTGGYLTGECLVYHLDHPERYSFYHYVTQYAAFAGYCRDPRVVWYVNAAPLPEAYREVVESSFPHRLEFAGNRGFSTILAASKKPFSVPWQEGQMVEPAPANH
jgi:hypothetical protein